MQLPDYRKGVSFGMEKKYDVVAMGELLVDFTPAGISESGRRLFEQNPGGAPVNMLAAVSKAGLSTAFIGKVGDDMHGRFLKETVEAQGIDTSGLVMAEDVFTTLAFVSLKEDGERDFSFARKPGADTKICFREVETELLQQTKIFHVGSLSLTDEPARTTTFQAVKMAKENGAIISYDPNYREPLWESREVATERMCSLIPFIDIMKISDEETELLTPYKDPQEAAEYLLQKGVKMAAVTLGAQGALICNKDGSRKVDGFKSKVIDTTGAGDSFWGGFVSQLLKAGEPLEMISLEQLADFAKYGNAMASLCVERRGGVSGIPQETEVIERLKGSCRTK